MAYRSISVWLEDMLMAIRQIEQMTTATNTSQEYSQNKILTLATERSLEIIAEALKNADKQDPELPISNKRRIINLRNLVNHVYYEVDNEKIWTIIKIDLPILREEVIKILEEYEGRLELNEL
jgi:uncharacterized protein with HEPN domain